MQVFLPRADGALADGLRATGAEVFCQPVQEAVDVPLSQPLRDADWVAVTSANTVRSLSKRGIRLPEGARVAAVGAVTARALEAAGYVVDLVPEWESSGRALAASFPEGPGRVLIPGSKLSSPTLADGLRAKGWAVDVVPVYTMAALDSAPGEAIRAWGSGQFDVVVVTSGSVGRAFAQLFGWRDDVRVVAFGEPSRRALAAAGVPVAATAATQDVAGLVEAIGSIHES
ncbi:uroporphyrinogen-III synthase [uncultured Tessaracoccus sp.]|uniref:uroporphyrinogen-III synthase n=1 Tax=uncultured Tessaracoccus sp. TaxID=905023 RepID=UPI00345CFAF8